MRSLGALGGNDSAATDINDLGQVVGNADTATGFPHAFRWTPTGGMRDLGTLGHNSLANAINDLGQVVGSADLPRTGFSHAFRWTPNGGMRDLGTLGGNESIATGINNLGQVIGTSDTANGETHAFRWTRTGGMRDLGTLGGRGSQPNAINDLGQVVGNAETAHGDTHAFRWTRTGGIRDLGGLGGVSRSAVAINDFGQASGESDTGTGYHAVLYDERHGRPRWDVARDFRIAPNQANPSPDQMGNPAVWDYLYDPTGQTKPAAYKLLPGFDTRKFGLRGLESWWGTNVWALTTCFLLLGSTHRAGTCHLSESTGPLAPCSSILGTTSQSSLAGEARSQETSSSPAARRSHSSPTAATESIGRSTKALTSSPTDPFSSSSTTTGLFGFMFRGVRASTSSLPLEPQSTVIRHWSD